ncbi:MAG UNVERIFIED_CONTAM: hypothetical protein MIO30_20180 [Methylobacterium ajmalii]
MLHDGADRVRDRVVNATRQKTMTALAPVRGLLTDWLPDVAKDLREWVDSFDKVRGPKPISLAKLRYATKAVDPKTGAQTSEPTLADPFVMGMVALKVVLDGIATERHGITGLAMEIGRACEHEQQVRAWEKADPDLFHRIQRRLDKDGATEVHRKRVNINRFNHLLSTGELQVSWDKWGQEMHLRVGVALLDCIIRATGWFERMPDPNHVFKAGSKRGPKEVFVPKPGLLEHLAKELDHWELRSPAYKPTIIPPKPWTNTRDGGYWTPYVRGPRLIRFKAHQEAQKEWAADEYEAIDMPQEYEAINWLQDRPWRINKAVLAVMHLAYTHNMAIGGLPLIEPIPEPAQPADIATNKEALKKWKQQRAQAVKKNLRRLGACLRTDRLLGVAFEYQDFEEIFFPHMMDFRGRKYPIPVGLQPQGDDASRALLELANGKAVSSDETGGWIAVHLSACWGFDKASYEDRIEWVREREALWRRIAADPLNNLEWTATSGPDKVDKPWCSLAAIYDWVAFLDHGEGYISHLPISVDGTCNGIQHLSAMTRDEVAGAYVNLIPGDKPRDIYKYVAGLLQDELEAVERGGVNAEHATYWLDLCGRNLPRGLTKRQVMVLPYGGSKDAFFKYTREWLDEADPLPEELDWENPATLAMLTERTTRITWLSLKMWDVVRRVVSGGATVMEWLQETAKATTKGNQPIFWTTPSGFVVRHFYGKVLEKQVKVMLGGDTVQLRVGEQTADLDAASQLRGIAPNFVHSLDAAALTLCLLAAKERGLDGFTCVHDAYGTHAADMWALYHILREAFVLVHSENMLAAFRQACSTVVIGQLLAERHDLDFERAGELASEQLPQLPDMGSLNLADVLSSDYFFA